MLRIEAEWLGQRLQGIEAERLSPLLNVGSANGHFRSVTQPWIERAIFAPLRQRGVAVQHLDIQQAQGVDIVGDLADASFISSLAGRGFRSLLCCNVLEHVREREQLCARLVELVPSGGYLGISVPHAFPYHPDPIDTMFRPTVREIQQLFPESRLVDGALLDGGCGWDYVDHNPIVIARKVAHRLVSLRGNDALRGTGSFVPWLFRRFQVSCAILQRGGVTA